MSYSYLDRVIVGLLYDIYNEVCDIKPDNMLYLHRLIMKFMLMPRDQSMTVSSSSTQLHFFQNK